MGYQQHGPSMEGPIGIIGCYKESNSGQGTLPCITCTVTWISSKRVMTGNFKWIPGSVMTDNKAPPL